MMSDTSQELDWDKILGSLENEEDKQKREGKSDSDFEALPKGPYNVVVQEADKLVSGNGNDMIKTRVQVTDGPYANRVLYSYIVFVTDNLTAMRLTLDRLAAFGITRELIAKQNPSLPAIAEMLVGLRAIALVDIQSQGEYKGRNEIRGFRALEDGTAQAPKVAKSAPAKPAGVPDISAASSGAVPSVQVPIVPIDESVSGATDPFEG